MISEFAFFRNRLGLTERDGDPVRYNAELNIGEYKFDNVSISDHTSILGSSKRRFKTIDKNGNKVLVANREALLKQKGFTADKIKDVSSADVSIVARSNLQSLFVSSNTLHVIAKIAYEWHCYGGIDPHTMISIIFEPILHFLFAINAVCIARRPSSVANRFFKRS